MNPFTSWMTKDGPGIPKEMPEKTGLALFAAVVVREAWELFKLNLLIVVFSLPVVTAPAAHAAATKISLAMLRDENVYLLRDFWQAFTRLFRRATIAGVVAFALVGIGLYAVYIWAQLAMTTPACAGPMVVCLAATVFVAMVASHLFVLIACSQAPLSRLVRLAVAASLTRPLPVLGGLAFVAVLWLAHVVFYPISVFMPAVFNFSLGVLGLTFAAREAAETVLAPRFSAERDVEINPFASARMRNQ